MPVRMRNGLANIKSECQGASLRESIYLSLNVCAAVETLHLRCQKYLPDHRIVRDTVFSLVNSEKDFMLLTALRYVAQSKQLIADNRLFSILKPQYKPWSSVDT